MKTIINPPTTMTLAQQAENIFIEAAIYLLHNRYPNSAFAANINVMSVDHGLMNALEANVYNGGACYRDLIPYMSKYCNGENEHDVVARIAQDLSKPTPYKYTSVGAKGE